MDDLQKLSQEIDQIKNRNLKVEIDKAWEISLFRKTLVSVSTYFVIVLFFKFANLSKPFVNAIVPTLGFLLSTLSIPFFKSFWIKNIYKK